MQMKKYKECEKEAEFMKERSVSSESTRAHGKETQRKINHEDARLQDTKNRCDANALEVGASMSGLIKNTPCSSFIDHNQKKKSRTNKFKASLQWGLKRTSGLNSGLIVRYPESRSFFSCRGWLHLILSPSFRQNFVPRRKRLHFLNKIRSCNWSS